MLRIGVVTLMGNRWRTPSPLSHRMVCRWRKCSGSWKSKTSKSSFFTAQMY